MKKWRQLVNNHVPKHLRHRLNGHMQHRPNGMARDKWIEIFIAKHRGDAVVIPPPLPFEKTSKRAHQAASDAFLQSGEWRRLRMVVIKARGARCECCGASPKDGVTVINVDHIKPRRDFPELALEESNLQILCGPCNHGKGNWDRTDWREDKPAPPGPRLVRRPEPVDMTDEEACRILDGRSA